MTRRDVIKAIYSMVGDMPIIFTTGFTCREAFDIEDRKSNFYMVGSMGLAASIGIGIALNSKEQSVMVIEGDGSFLMCPNNIFIAGNLKVKNFIHIVIDNQMYESTGQQKTYSHGLDFSQMAFLAGYTTCKKVEDIEEFKKCLFEAICFKAGPVFFHLIVDTANTKMAKRIPMPLVQVKNRISNFLQTKLDMTEEVENRA